ncbi:hypothetical protein Micbo1qcDRAFT_178956 [Microdochium bolleyi]|uniref:Uncharacterized protein n=1 Tax=Microdochium bolleyi TaxID=196109 RepID=A0A136IRU2_9PEZI|nr:hypothetical protein Micbo1qcDRAFT_178956 [Microdochium bolleyi]
MLSLVTLLLAAASAIDASAAAPALLQSRQCSVEGKTKICYGVNGGTSQVLDVDKLQYLASYLRFVGQRNSGINAFFQMPTITTCQEWAIPLPERTTTLVLAKHVSPFVKFPVLYEDIANTIDGGEEVTDAQHAATLLNCAANGGPMSIAVNSQKYAHASADLKNSKSKVDGIVIELVKVPA